MVNYPVELQSLIDNNPSRYIGLKTQSDFTGHVCPNCGGAEMVFVYEIETGPWQAPSGKCKWLSLAGREGWYTGKWHKAPCPQCRAGQAQAWLAKNCGLSGHDLSVSLESFYCDREFSDKKPGRDLVAAVLENGKNASGFITFSGGYGRGKSHLLKALVNGMRALGVYARYITLANLLAEIRDRFGEKFGESPEDVISYYRSIRVLCIDEIDKVNLTEWARDVIFRLMDSRYNESSVLLTACAMNADVGDMPGYLVSRMKGGTFMKVAGADMRQVLQPALALGVNG